MALNDMKSLALEFQELVFIAGTSIGYDKTQFGTRFSNLLFEHPAIVHYAGLFGKQLEKKAKSLANCIGDFNKELTSQEKGGDDKVIFIINTKERLKLRDRVIHDVDEFLEAIIREKIKLYSG